MLVGKVKWFNKVKGYGFIVSENNKDDVFIHIKTLEKSNIKMLDEGQHVIYEAEIKDGRLRAISIALFTEESELHVTQAA